MNHISVRLDEHFRHTGCPSSVTVNGEDILLSPGNSST
jgi:hypothetical protein